MKIHIHRRYVFKYDFRLHNSSFLEEKKKRAIKITLIQWLGNGKDYKMLISDSIKDLSLLFLRGHKYYALYIIHDKNKCSVYLFNMQY